MNGEKKVTTNSQVGNNFNSFSKYKRMGTLLVGEERWFPPIVHFPHASTLHHLPARLALRAFSRELASSLAVCMLGSSHSYRLSVPAYAHAFARELTLPPVWALYKPAHTGFWLSEASTCVFKKKSIRSHRELVDRM